MARRPSLLERWPTGVVLLLLLTAALLPLGLVLAWVTDQNIRDTERALVERSDQQGIDAAHSIESLLARNVLALRIAASAAMASSRTSPCAAAVRSLSVSPAVAQRFRIRDEQGREICTVGQFQGERPTLHVAPGGVRDWLSPEQRIQ